MELLLRATSSVLAPVRGGAVVLIVARMPPPRTSGSSPLLRPRPCARLDRLRLTRLRSSDTAESVERRHVPMGASARLLLAVGLLLDAASPAASAATPSATRVVVVEDRGVVAPSQTAGFSER